MTDTVSLPIEDKPIAAPRLGGWLLLPALHLALTPFIFFAAASTTNDTIVTLVHNGRIARYPQGETFQLVTWALPGAYLILTIVAGIHFFRRSRKTPPVMQTWYITGVVIGIISLPYMAYLLGLEYNASGLGQSVGWTLGWLIYFSKSKRVRSTFVVNIGNSYLDRAVFATVAITVIAGAISLFVVGGPNADTSETANAGSIATPSLTPIVVEDRWPKAFTMTTMCNNLPQASVDDALSGNNILEDMAGAYGFCAGQEWSVHGLEARFPQYAQQLAFAQAAFDLKFKDSVDNINRILEAKLPDDWHKARQQLHDTLEKQIDFNSLTESDATSVLEMVKDRSEGKIPSPHLEILLTFNPAYMANPASEMADGYKREFRTDGSGAADGVKLSMEYPCSWRADSGQRFEGAVEMFTSENGKGLSLLSIGVASLPPEVSREIAKTRGVSNADLEQVRGSATPEILEQLSQQVGFHNTHTLDSGVATLSGHPTLWAEYTAEMNRVGIQIKFHNLMILFFDRNRLLCFMCMCGAGPDSKITADDQFKRNAGLFQLMLNSLVVQDDPSVADDR
jgi:hypothetical protein